MNKEKRAAEIYDRFKAANRYGQLFSVKHIIWYIVELEEKLDKINDGIVWLAILIIICAVVTR